MDGQQKPTESLSDAIRSVTARLKARAAMAKKPLEDPIPIEEPIDCEALYDLIQAAQSLYRDECPGV